MRPALAAHGGKVNVVWLGSGKAGYRRDMYRYIALVAAALAIPAIAQDVPVQGPPKPLTIEQGTAMKCSAAFALVAARQAGGGGAEWPAMMPRGREFMVRASAQLMDDTGRTREQIAAELTAQARELREPGALAAVMPPCLLLLDASGL